MNSALPCVLIYGNSLRLMVVESRLRALAGLQVVHIDPQHATALAELAVMGPGVLLYDPQDTQAEVIRAVQVLHPEVKTLALTEDLELGLAGEAQVALAELFSSDKGDSSKLEIGNSKSP